LEFRVYFWFMVSGLSHLYKDRRLSYAKASFFARASEDKSEGR